MHRDMYMKMYMHVCIRIRVIVCVLHTQNFGPDCHIYIQHKYRHIYLRIYVHVYIYVCIHVYLYTCRIVYVNLHT